MINECIILAGGEGKRLQSVFPNQAKCMAPVNGNPLLYYIIEHLINQEIEKFIFALGYKSKSVIDYLNEQYPKINIQFSVEELPLGTGGALKKACEKAKQKTVLVVNGDTLFSIDVNKLIAFNSMCGADCTLSLKPMQNFERYGTVELAADYSIITFTEKQYTKSGLINGGVYAMHVPNFLKEDLPVQFSFEKDYLENYYSKRKMYGMVQDEYFIDIGTPEDYENAKVELKTFSK